MAQRSLPPELKFAVLFYQTVGGHRPAWDFIKSLDKEGMTKVGFDLKRLQIGFPVGMPLCRSLGNGLHEVRTSLATKREARLIFFVYEDNLVIVSGFIKKMQKTPDLELKTAFARKKEFLTNNL